MLIFGYVVTYILVTFQVVEVGIWGIRHRAYDWVNFKNLLNSYRFGSRDNAVNWVNTGCKVPYPYVSDMRIGENSNNVGLSALIGGASAYFIYPVIQNKKDKIACIILGIVIILFGFWTNSRSFILFVILLGIAVLVFSIIHKRTKPIDAFIVLFSVLLFISLLSLIDTKTLIRIVNRFFEKDASSAGNRLTLISEYFSKMFTKANYVLFGVGATNILHEYALSAPPHTNFVQLACGYGLPITLLFIGLIVYCLIKFQKRIKITNYRFGFYVPMMFGFLFTLTDQIFFPTSILISLISTIIIASFNNKKSEIVVPEDVHYKTLMDNFDSSYYFAADGLLIDDKKRNNMIFNPSEIVTEEQRTKLIQDIIEYKPAYIVVNYEDLNHRKILSKQFRKIKTSVLIVVCDKNTHISFVEKAKKSLIWSKCLFVYRDEATAIKFENKKFVQKYQKLIVGDSSLIIEDILGYLKK
ncbi:MAG: O-antigen ligase family protein [Bacilli bacterium]|nr:O-antigen ligase family protein [Bacilli bacterium]